VAGGKAADGQLAVPEAVLEATGLKAGDAVTVERVA
jgi:hypothetical protein